MARKRYNDEDILRLLREIEVHLHGGMDVEPCGGDQFTWTAAMVIEILNMSKEAA